MDNSERNRILSGYDIKNSGMMLVGYFAAWAVFALIGLIFTGIFLLVIVHMLIKSIDRSDVRGIKRHLLWRFGCSSKKHGIQDMPDPYITRFES